MTIGLRPAATSRRASRGARRALVAWGFSLPFALFFSVFMLIPILSSLAMSFTDFTAVNVQNPLAVDFVGLSQYVSVFSDGQFLSSLGVTAYFVVVGLPLTIGLALVLALALNSGINRFRAFFRVGFYLPVVCSIVAIAVIWRFILQNDGFMNAMLSWFGIQGPNWLNSTTWAMPAMILMAVWRNTGTLMIIFLAGLQGISPEMKEASALDGAGIWQRFIHITLPLMRPTLLLGAVLTSVGYLQFFEEPFVMTNGGPLGSTTSAAYYIFNQFSFGKYGTASAASYVLFIIIALISLVQFRALRSNDSGGQS
ncbi:MULTISPECIES: sugar ABC transporter permease [unclassified Leifsonia]|uniref:carbohydrate ABC transporter permease n=1 Tax=unclassified Leifsonia TaxID=2663824 RepID=UPI0008A7A38A|nr:MULTISPECIES: sugar ABC transporter permease [unclassified Leifsonia]SEH56731.1 carbohydrate ABC transporter membrane protein 1, CUT1 family [Leifsonia sp. CL154]SFL22134.1 carbohydrate ABC transporter membrane protein 1, CUT1 family [Leifsonia sp. CL147]